MTLQGFYDLFNTGAVFISLGVGGCVIVQSLADLSGNYSGPLH